MKNTIKLLTYTELTQLSDGELTKSVGLALSQLDEAVRQGEDTIEKAQIYQVYENELAKRHYRQRARY